MKIKDIRNLTKEELTQKEEELRESVFKLKTQVQLGQAEKSHNFNLMKKNIARIKTVLKENKK